MKTLARLAAASGLIALAGCGSVPTSDGRVYHCVATDHPIPPPNTFAPKTPLEYFEYGDFRDASRPTISGNGYCSVLRVPPTATLIYLVDGRRIEKHFDLSRLTPSRVADKTVEFFVDKDRVEVRLITPQKGYLSSREIIDVK